MNVRHYIVATAGHVDHGKSSLVKALTGVDPDRLPEEKARGITIDLGFAHLEIPGSLAGKADLTFKLGIVDVPGHEDFVKNMVAGVGSIDLALFVVAADDGWMPQTEEHLQILSYLGVRRGIVVLTKTDLAEGREVEVTSALGEKLKGSTFEGTNIVPTSAIRGTGLDELKQALASILKDMPVQMDIGKPRLPVDRAFTLQGIGTVVTGTLTGGTLKRGQEVIVQPSGKTSRVRSLQSHNRNTDACGPSTRTAVNLPDLAVASKDQAATGNEIHRGDVLTLKELGRPSRFLDVVLERTGRLMEGEEELRPIRSRMRVRLHHCSSNTGARILLINAGELGRGQSCLAHLRLETPVFAFAGDRFILRDWSEQRTLAGGRILDAEAEGRRVRSEARVRFLTGRAASPGDASVFVGTQLARDGVMRKGPMPSRVLFSQAEVEQALSQLVKSGHAIAVGDMMTDPAWWAQVRQCAAEAIDAEHRDHPEHPGLVLTRLRAVVEGKGQPSGFFDALVADLCKSEFTQTAGAIRRRTHQLSLPPNLQGPVAQLRAALAAKPMDPPSRKELVSGPAGEQALRFLLDAGEVIRISDDIIFVAESLRKATEMVRGFLAAKGRGTASDLRQAVGTSRRVIIPLLERLDKEGVTVRQGDQRTLKKSA